MTELTTIEEGQHQLPATSTGSVLAMIERAARDPSVNVANMKELFALQERMLAIQARADFADALRAVQEELAQTRITRTGNIIILEKNSNKVLQNTKYAKYEDIDRIVRPVLLRHGFTLNHRTGYEDGKVKVTGVLTHRGPAGTHEETSEMVLPLDTSGSKNNVQGAGSAVSYGRRYTMTTLINIVTEGEDDDGNGGKPEEPPELVSDAQVATLSRKLSEGRIRLDTFLQSYDIEALHQLPAALFEPAMERIEARIKELHRREREEAQR